MWLDPSVKTAENVLNCNLKKKFTGLDSIFLKLLSDNPHILLFSSQNQDPWLNLVGVFDYPRFVKVIIS